MRRARYHFGPKLDERGTAHARAPLLGRACGGSVRSCFLNAIECDTTKPTAKATSKTNTHIAEPKTDRATADNRREHNKKKRALFAKINVATAPAEPNAKQTKHEQRRSLARTHPYRHATGGNNNNHTRQPMKNKTSSSM